MTEGGNWEGKTILNRLNGLPIANTEIERPLAACARRLLARRASRIRPGFDDKVLADWNGLDDRRAR